MQVQYITGVFQYGIQSIRLLELQYLPREIAFFNSLTIESIRLKAVPVKSWHLDINGIQLSPVPPHIELPGIRNLTEAVNNKGVLW